MPAQTSRVSPRGLLLHQVESQPLAAGDVGVGYGPALRIAWPLVETGDIMTTTIFLADDHAVFREALSMLLETQPGFRVIGSTGDGWTAVREVCTYTPDVAILDIAMPGLSGIDVARELAKLGSPTRIIILSMHPAVHFVIQALQAGVCGYVVKTSVGSEILRAIHAVAGGQHYLSPELLEATQYTTVEERKPDPPKSPLSQLSAREREVLQLVVEGYSSTQIAKMLSLSVSTVDTYRSRIMRKLGIKDLPSLVKFAIQHGLIRLD